MRTRATRRRALACLLLGTGPAAVAEPLTAPLPVPAAEIAAALELPASAWTPRDLPLLVARRIHVPWGERGRGAAVHQRIGALCQAGTPPRGEEIDSLLSLAEWSAALERRVSRNALTCTLLTQPRAALLYHGLAGMAPAARAALARDREALRDLAGGPAPAFAAFAPALRVRGNEIEVPGGAEARALWEKLLDARADRPGEFAVALFERDGGRTAALYATLAAMDAGARAWALRLAEPGLERRHERFSALVSVFGSEDAFWEPSRAPLSRRSVDGARVLLAVRTATDGRLAPPARRGFWQAAFADGTTLPREDATEADAAFFVREIARADTAAAERRLGQLLFAQRLLEHGAAPDVDAVAATRSAGTRPGLALALEALDAAPSLQAAAWRRSSELAALPRESAASAIVQFQGGLALLLAARRNGLLPPVDALELVAAAVAIGPGPDGYGGRLAAWLEQRLLPALAIASYGGAEPGDADAIAARALAGVRPARPAAATFVFEGLAYREDVASGRRQRLESFARSQDLPPLAPALDLARAASQLATEVDEPALEAVRKAVQFLPRFVPVGATEPVDPQRRAAELLAALRSSDGARGSQVARLAAAADAAVADALAGLLYAAHASPLQERAPAALARRHVLGLGLGSAEERARFAFALPRAAAGSGRPWRIEGGLLGLEAGFARVALRRASPEPPAGAPALGDAERDTLGLWAGLLAAAAPGSLPVPSRVREAHERGHGLLRAIHSVEPAPGRGGIRETDLPLRDRIDALRLDPWRTERLRAALLAGEQAEALFGLAELVALGGHEWPAGFGTPQLRSAYRLALALPRDAAAAELFGRERSGRLAERSLDLPVRLLLSLDARGLPAALLPALLPYAAQDAFEQAQLLHAEDDTALARFARALPEHRIDDYLAALAGDGALPAAEQAP